MSQLTKNEIRKIKRYCILSYIAKASMLSAIFTMVLGGIFLMIDGAYLDAQSFYSAGLTVMISLSSGLIFLSAMASSFPNCELNSSRWKDIEGKLEQKYIEDGDLIVLEDGRKKVTWNSTFIQQRKHMGTRQRIHTVAKEFSINTASEKMWKFVIMILPLLIVTLVFIPEFKSSITWKKEQVAAVAGAQMTLEEEFKKINYTSYYDDATSSGESFFMFSAYPYDSEDESYCNITLNKKGQIKEISYSTDVLVGQSLDEVYEAITEVVFKQNEIISQSGVEAENPELLEQNQVSRALIRQFEDPSGNTNEYTEIYVNGVRNTMYYGIEYATETSPGVIMFSVELQEDYE